VQALDAVVRLLPPNLQDTVRAFYMQDPGALWQLLAQTTGQLQQQQLLQPPAAAAAAGVGDAGGSAVNSGGGGGAAAAAGSKGAGGRARAEGADVDAPRDAR
jgi:hypothetical protein